MKTLNDQIVTVEGLCMHFLMSHCHALFFVPVELTESFLKPLQASKCSGLLRLGPLKCQHTRNFA